WPPALGNIAPSSPYASAPAKANTPPAAKRPRMSAGCGQSRAMSPVVRKIPLPTVAPMVMSAPSSGPSDRRSLGAVGAAWTSGTGRSATVTGAAILPWMHSPGGPSTGSLHHCVDPSLEQLLAEFDPGLPLARARSLPSPWYRDPRIEALERERVLGNSWQLVAR